MTDNRWGFLLGTEFIPIPRGPLLAEDPERRPPFVVTLPSGERREIVEEVGGAAVGPVGDAHV